MIGPLEHRLARVILELDFFTSDDVTGNGQVTVDDAHTPNGAQNGIGSLFQAHHRAGHIDYADRAPVRSKAPHRKGGLIRVWQPTVAGRRWAASNEDRLL